MYCKFSFNKHINSGVKTLLFTTKIRSYKKPLFKITDRKTGIVRWSVKNYTKSTRGDLYVRDSDATQQREHPQTETLHSAALTFPPRASQVVHKPQMDDLANDAVSCGCVPEDCRGWREERSCAEALQQNNTQQMMRSLAVVLHSHSVKVDWIDGQTHRRYFLMISPWCSKRIRMKFPTENPRKPGKISPLHGNGNSL